MRLLKLSSSVEFDTCENCQKSSIFIVQFSSGMSETLFDTCVNWSCVTRCWCRTTSSTLFTVCKMSGDGDNIIIYPHKVILTWFRLASKPKTEKVGLKGPLGHPSPVVKILFFKYNRRLVPWWVLHLLGVMWLWLSNRAEEGEMSYLCHRKLAPMRPGPTRSLFTLWPLHKREGRCKQFCT
jgi:hypothetical protein